MERFERLLPLGLAVYAVMLLVGPTAQAQEAKSRVLVIPAQGAGVSDELAAGVVDTLRERLGAYGDLDLLDTPATSLIDEMFELECFDLDDDCLRKLAQKYKASKLLVAALEKSERGGFVVDVKLYDPTAGRVTASFRRIEVAGGETSGMAEQAVASLFGEPPPPKPEKGTIQVTASVAGASVRVGSVGAGETPFTAEVTPGTYPVSVKKAGYKEFVRRVTIEAGGVVTIHAPLELVPIPTATPGPATTPPDDDDDEVEATPIYKQWWFWTGIGAVVVGGVVTTVLLLQPGDSPSRGNLDITLSPFAVDSDPVFQR